MSLFNGGGGALFWEGGSQLFPSFLGEGHNFLQGFLREGHNFFKSIFIEKINYEYPAAAGFRFLLILPRPSKKNVQRAETKRSV